MYIAKTESRDGVEKTISVNIDTANESEVIFFKNNFTDLLEVRKFRNGNTIRQGNQETLMPAT